MLNLRELLEIENKPEILNFRFEYDDILMWPFVRFFIYEALFSREYKWAAHPATLRFDLSLSEKVRYALKSFEKRPSLNRAQYDIVMMISGISNFKRDGFFFNKLSDHFAFLYEKQTVLIEGSVRGRYYSPRSFPNIYYQDMIEIEASLSSRFQRPSTKDAASVERLIDYLRAYVRTDLDNTVLSVVKDTLTSVSTKLRRYHQCYKTIFNRMKPRLFLLEDASSGVRSYVLKWAKERNIVTAEPQHGMLYENHSAYNYSEHILMTEQYRSYLPDYFLTYGQYWNDTVNMPVPKIVIGSPNYHENIKKLGNKDGKINSRIRIMMVSSSAGVLKKIMLELACIIDRNKYEIVFRPHPMERPLLKERYAEVLADSSIRIDDETNLYESLYDADYLVGEPSTVLYEAFGICKSIFVVDMPTTALFFPQNVIRRIKDANELYEEIKKESVIAGNFTIDIEDIWNAQWKKNYKNFIESFGL